LLNKHKHPRLHPHLELEDVNTLPLRWTRFTEEEQQLEVEEDTHSKLSNLFTPIKVRLEVLPSYSPPVWQEMTSNNLNNLSIPSNLNSKLGTLVKDKQHMEHPLEVLIRWQINFKG
jgi:hypothetical protein